MRIIALLLLISLIFTAEGYRDIIPGKTNLEECLKTLGKPLVIEPTINGNNYFYNKFKINTSSPDENVVSSISIFGDETYVTSSGI
jgi:hypothetical protein